MPEGAAKGIFDGVDLNWEWPGSAGNAGNVVRDEDRHNFTLLAAEFRRQLDKLGKRHYDLTAFLPAAPAKIDAGFEGEQIFKYLDFGTVQGYDFHGSWESRTNQQSSIFVPKGAPDNPDFSADNAINAWLGAKAPRSKLVLGLPYYSQGWTGITSGRARVAVRRHHVLDLRRPGADAPEDRLHPGERPGWSDDVVARRRRRPGVTHEGDLGRPRPKSYVAVKRTASPVRRTVID